MKDRLGEININNQGEQMKIIEYIDAKNIKVLFLNTNNIVKSRYSHFKEGSIKDYMYPSILNVGYLGTPNKVNTKDYSYYCWIGMLDRCYGETDKNPTYKDVTVCEEWLNYSNFKQWFDINYYEIEGESVQLDKDLLLKGNKIYCPKFCCFLPKIINEAIIDNKKKKNNKNIDIPIGVNPHGDKFQCNIRKYGKQYYIGTYNTIEEASEVYNAEKEKYIKELADKYKKYITEESYNALKKYKIGKEVSYGKRIN